MLRRKKYKNIANTAGGLLQRRMNILNGNREEEDNMKEWKLLYNETLEDDVVSITIDKDVNGNDFEVDELFVLVKTVATDSDIHYFRIKPNDTVGVAYYGVVSSRNRCAKMHTMLVDGKFMDVGSLAGNNEYSLTAMSSYGSMTGIDLEEKIKKITLSTNSTTETVLKSGSEYTVYGR